MSRKEGETSYRETAFGVIPRSKLIILEIEGIGRAWNFVIRKRLKGAIPLTPAMMNTIHRVGFGWIFPKMAGKFRSIDVEVSFHRPPHFYLVPQLMLDFCRDLAERMRHLPPLQDRRFVDDLISLVAWAHHRFLWIHPFQDYNGRMARLLINIIFLNLDLPPIELRVETTKNRRIYIRALQAADQGKFGTLEQLIRQAIDESAKELERR